MLPIYGSGALVILISTIGVRKNPWLIFVLGMIAATLLEYITGAVMERLFHVRYWDYSNQKLNLRGYICVSSSLCWGAFSVLLVRVVHVPIEQAVLDLPTQITDMVAFTLTVVASIDLTQSFNEAMDMKHILLQLEESRQQIIKMQEKLKVTSEEMLADYRRRSDEIREDYRRRATELAEKGRSRKEAYLDRIDMKREQRRIQLEKLAERAEFLMKDELPSKMDALIGEDRRKELTVLKDNIMKELNRMSSRTDRNYLRIASQLRRNPTAASGKFAYVLEELRDLLDNMK